MKILATHILVNTFPYLQAEIEFFCFLLIFEWNITEFPRKVWHRLRKHCYKILLNDCVHNFSGIVLKFSIEGDFIFLKHASIYNFLIEVK